MKHLFPILATAAVILAACDKTESESNTTVDELTAPANVACSENNATSLTFTWDAVSGAKTYQARLESSSDSAKSKTVEEPTATFTGLTEGATYTFKVRAISGDVVSSWSSTVTAVAGTEAVTQTDEATSLGYTVYPAQNATDAYQDTYLTLTFKSAPTLGTSGNIAVYGSAGNQVDLIKIEDAIADKAQIYPSTTVYNTAMNALYSGKQYRIVHYDPVTVEDKTVTIRLHNNVLEHGATYYVTIDAEAISADNFSGIEAGDWVFTTKSAPTSTDLTVGAGDGYDFYTLQGAFTYLASTSGSTTITLADGVYAEPLFLRGRDNVTVKGSSLEACSIEYANCENLTNGTGGSTSSAPSVGSTIDKSGGRSVMLIENCDNLRFENISMINTWDGTRNQAEFIYYNDGSGTRKVAFVNCLFHSRQDTICIKGYSWFYNCTIEGNVDYIWGSANIALFEKCTIRTISDSTYSRAYIVQARALAESNLGFVFLNCTIEADSGCGAGTNYLARSGGNTTYYDNVAYINCTMASSVPTVGWWTSDATPQPSTATATAGWREYNTNGTTQSGRPSCVYIMTETEATTYYKDRSTIFSGVDQTWLSE